MANRRQASGSSPVDLGAVCPIDSGVRGRLSHSLRKALESLSVGTRLASGSSLGLATNLGQAVSFYPHRLLNDYAERWNVDLQQQMPGGILFEMGICRTAWRERRRQSKHQLCFAAISQHHLNIGQYRDPAVYANLDGRLGCAVSWRQRKRNKGRS
jgi:hypothetical protein